MKLCNSFILLILLSGIFIHLIATTPAIAAEEIVTIESRPGVSLPLLLISPESSPAAGLLIYVGGGGGIGLKADREPGKRGGNFLFRTADMFVQAGFLVAIIDTPSDHRTSLWNLRTDKDHAKDAAAAIALLRSRTTKQVWVIGTSMGSASAANAAARLGDDGPDGAVLTSSVTELSRNTAESVLTVDLEAIRIPLLVVNHQDDACFAALPRKAQRILDEASNSPRRERMIFTGGKSPESDACEPFSPHGFFGIEQDVVTAITDWIRSSPPMKK